jgi:hypothetical protein
MGKPARPARDLRLDVIRGAMQLIIFASHVDGSWLGAWAIPGSWGASDSSEQFLFLSGFVLGSLFAYRTAHSGYWAAARDMAARLRRLYRYQMMVFAGFLLLAVFYRLTGWLTEEIDWLHWDYLFAHPVAALLGGAALLYQPVFLDTLPVFLFSMLLLPGFAALEARAGAFALLAPLSLYALVSLAGYTPVLLGGEPPAFNVFTWQILFFIGAWLGRAALRGETVVPRGRWVTLLAALIVAAGFVLRLSQHGFIAWHDQALIDLAMDKRNLAWPRIVHALALAVLAARLVPREAGWMRGLAGRSLAAIGRHSLQVFCAGLFVSRAATLVLRYWPEGFALDAGLILSGVLLLALFAQAMDGGLRRATPAARPQPESCRSPRSSR